MNLGLDSVAGSALVISQFTLLGDCEKGRRPSFTRAAEPKEAERLYERFVARLRARGITVATGVFGAMMQVSLTNEGPVTLLVDSAPWKRRLDARQDGRPRAERIVSGLSLGAALLGIRGEPLILASLSPRRRELLQMLAIRHEAVVPDVSEGDRGPAEPPERYVERLALAKAQWVPPEHGGLCRSRGRHGRMPGRGSPREAPRRWPRQGAATQALRPMARRVHGRLSAPPAGRTDRPRARVFPRPLLAPLGRRRSKITSRRESRWTRRAPTGSRDTAASSSNGSRGATST